MANTRQTGQPINPSAPRDWEPSDVLSGLPPEATKTYKKDTLLKAIVTVSKYSLVFEPHEEAGFVARALEMPLVMGEGKSIVQAFVAAREALVVTAAALLAHGKVPPAPFREGRNVQINVRVSQHEKLLLEATAQSYGYRSVGSFIRSAALMRAGISGSEVLDRRKT